MNKKTEPDAWMPLIIGKYLRKTTRLTRDQHGGYLLLLMDYWVNGAPPDDDRVLAAITKSSLAEWKRLRPVLVVFFEVRDGHWYQERAETELAKAHRLVDQKATAGAASGEARRQRNGQRRGNGRVNGKVNGEGTAGSTAGSTADETANPLPFTKEEITLPSELDAARAGGENFCPDGSGCSEEPSKLAEVERRHERPPARAPSVRTARTSSIGAIVAVVQSLPDPKWADQQSRDDYAVQEIVKVLGGTGPPTGQPWAIMLAADDPADPQHASACRAVRNAAKVAGVGWISRQERERRRGTT